MPHNGRDDGKATCVGSGDQALLIAETAIQTAAEYIKTSILTFMNLKKRLNHF